MIWRRTWSRFPIEEENETTLPTGTAGSESLETAEWVHSLRVVPLDANPGLAVLTVVVEQPPETTVRPVRFELSRWIDDPLENSSEVESDAAPGLELANQGSVIP